MEIKTDGYECSCLILFPNIIVSALIDGAAKSANLLFWYPSLIWFHFNLIHNSAPSMKWWSHYVMTSSMIWPRLWNDLYCVEWDVKLYYTIPSMIWQWGLISNTYKLLTSCTTVSYWIWFHPHCKSLKKWQRVRAFTILRFWHLTPTYCGRMQSSVGINLCLTNFTATSWYLQKWWPTKIFGHQNSEFTSKATSYKPATTST